MSRMWPLFFYAVALVVGWWLVTGIFVSAGLSGHALTAWCVASLVAAVFGAAVRGFKDGYQTASFDILRGQP
jgi:hypothetical protein